MAKQKKAVSKKEAVFGQSMTKSGQKLRVGTRVTYDDGTDRILLTPAGKGAKAAKELRWGVCMTNSGQVKVDKDGVTKKLTKEQRAWRSGYLSARKDNAAAWKAKAGKKPLKGERTYEP